MKNKLILRFTAVGILASAVFGSTSAAQNFTTKAPTPADWTALAKLPDLNGVWERGGVGAGGRGNQAAANPAGGAAQVTRGQRGNAGAAPRGPVYTPEYEAKRKAFLASPPEDNATANCLPPGMPGIMNQPYPMEFLLTPGKVTIVIEAYTQVRHIYTDGRPLPEDPDPGFFGTSVGRWEGDTLVVDSVGFSELTQIARGIPHGGRMTIVERFRLADPETMTVETTVTDPHVPPAPYKTTPT